MVIVDSDRPETVPSSSSSSCATALGTSSIYHSVNQDLSDGQTEIEKWVAVWLMIEMCLGMGTAFATTQSDRLQWNKLVLH